MISIGKFSTELNEIEATLKDLELLDDRNFSPAEILDVAEFRHANLIDNWKLLIRYNIYDIMLKDNSIFSFKINSLAKTLSYSFIECPFICLSYKEFLSEQGIEEDFSKTFVEEYNLYVEQCEIKDSILYIRYDVDFDSYINGLHPASHLHIGHGNEIRIAINKILTPKAFLNFILRQHFTAYWKELLKADPQHDWLKYHTKHKTELPIIEEKFFNNYDLNELYLE